MFKAAVFPDERPDSRYSNILSLVLIPMTHMQFGVLPRLGNAHFLPWCPKRIWNYNEGRFEERVSAGDDGLMTIGN